LYQEVADTIAGACGYCARAYKAELDVKTARVPLLEEYEGHPSVRRLIVDACCCVCHRFHLRFVVVPGCGWINHRP